MKLLFSISFYTPYVSGLTLFVKRLAEKFASENYQCTVLTNRHKRRLKPTETINRVRVARAVPIFSVSKGFLSIDFAVKSYIEAKNNNIIFINLPQFEGIFPAIFGKLMGKRVIAIYHCEVKLPSGILNFFSEMSL